MGIYIYLFFFFLGGGGMPDIPDVYFLVNSRYWVQAYKSRKDESIPHPPWGLSLSSFNHVPECTIPALLFSSDKEPGAS